MSEQIPSGMNVPISSAHAGTYFGRLVVFFLWTCARSLAATDRFRFGVAGLPSSRAASLAGLRPVPFFGIRSSPRMVMAES